MKVMIDTGRPVCLLLRGFIKLPELASTSLSCLMHSKKL